MDGKFNVASSSCLPGSIDRLYERFEEAMFTEEYLPDLEGWMPVNAFPGQIVGRIAIRDKLGELVAGKIDRDRPYSRAQKCNFMRESQVLDRCQWPVQSIPAIQDALLMAITGELLETRYRRNRGAITDCRSGSGLIRSATM